MGYMFTILLLLALCQQLKEYSPTESPPKPIIFVVHMEKEFEGAQRVSPNVIQITQGKEIYLLSSSNDWITNTIIPQCKPDHIVYAPAGMHYTIITRNEVTVCGGYLRGCLGNATKCLLTDNPKLKIRLPMRAVYVGDKNNLLEYYKKNYDNDPNGLKKYISSIYDFLVDVQIEGESITIRRV